MSASLTIVYATAYSGADKKKSPKLWVTGLCEGNSPVTGESPHKGPATRKMFLFDDVIMIFPFSLIGFPVKGQSDQSSKYVMSGFSIPPCATDQ